MLVVRTVDGGWKGFSKLAFFLVFFLSSSLSPLYYCFQVPLTPSPLPFRILSPSSFLSPLSSPQFSLPLHTFPSPHTTPSSIYYLVTSPWTGAGGPICNKVDLVCVSLLSVRSNVHIRSMCASHLYTSSPWCLQAPPSVALGAGNSVHLGLGRLEPVPHLIDY